jgi:RNA polymerase sigma factor (sigma-70 family)
VATQDSYPENTGQTGDGEFEKLVGMHYEPLYRFAMSLTRAESEACDLVQETFLTWAEKHGQLVDRSKAKSWLFTTLHRAFLQSRRRITRFPHLEIDEAAAQLPAVEPGVMARLEAAEVLDLLQAIDPQFRAAVALFYLEDYSYQEIAEVLDVPLGTVKSRIARGLNQLKKLMLDRASREPQPGGTA